MNKYEEIKELLVKLLREHHRETVTAFISIETGEEINRVLNLLYDRYMYNDDYNLINDFFYNHDEKTNE